MQTELALRLAASESRIEKHQEAYVLARQLLGSLHTGTGDEHVSFCFNWFERNNLYLAGGARSAFWEACVAARDYRLMRPGNYVDKEPEVKSRMHACYQRVVRAPELIAAAVQLPPLSQEDVEIMQEVAEEQASKSSEP